MKKMLKLGVAAAALSFAAVAVAGTTVEIKNHTGERLYPFGVQFGSPGSSIGGFHMSGRESYLKGTFDPIVPHADYHGLPALQFKAGGCRINGHYDNNNHLALTNAAPSSDNVCTITVIDPENIRVDVYRDDQV